MEKLAIILPVVLIIFIIVLILKLNKTVDESDKLDIVKSEVVYYKKLSELLEEQVVILKEMNTMNEDLINNFKDKIELIDQRKAL